MFYFGQMYFVEHWRVFVVCMDTCEINIICILLLLLLLYRKYDSSFSWLKLKSHYVINKYIESIDYFVEEGLIAAWC